MEYKGLLLNLDHSSACAQRTDVALSLARQFEAQVTVVFCIGRLDISEGWVHWPDYRNLPPSFHDRDSERASDALQEFSAKAERAGVSFQSITAETAIDQVGNEIATQARYNDLAIIGQANPNEPQTGGHQLTEHVMLACGRPTLIVPYPRGDRSGQVPSRIGKRVMVAWDASREATRAVHDTMPLLQAAEQVDVVAALPHKPQRQGPTPTSDLARHLARHHVAVEVHDLNPAEIGKADAILAQLADLGSDLLVMGGYGHSYMRELVMGRMTRQMLDTTTVPVLMSH